MSFSLSLTMTINWWPTVLKYFISPLTSSTFTDNSRTADCVALLFSTNYRFQRWEIPSESILVSREAPKVIGISSIFRSNLSIPDINLPGENLRNDKRSPLQHKFARTRKMCEILSRSRARYRIASADYGTSSAFRSLSISQSISHVSSSFTMPRDCHGEIRNVTC